MLSKKYQKWGVRKKDEKREEVGHIGGLSIEGGFKPSAQCALFCAFFLFYVM